MRFLIVLIIASLCGVARGQLVVIHDQTFDLASWVIDHKGGTNVSTITALQVIGGGVTGNARVTVVTGTSPLTYQAGHYKTDVTFDPSTQGVITSLTWQLWYKFTGAPSSYGFLRMIARQGGGAYMAPQSHTEPQNAVPQWQKGSGALVPSNYVLFAGSGPPTLDFSPTAPPIEFGYFVSSAVFLSTPVVNHWASFFDLQIQTTPFVGWADLDSGLAGTSGIPSLVGTGTLQPGSTGELALTSAKPSSPALLLVSLASAPLPFKGGVLIPVPVAFSIDLSADGSGSATLPFVWPSGIPSLTSLYFQQAIQDPAGPQGVALSNALKAVTP